MTRTDVYAAALRDGRDPVELALTESGLPGPRGNLELIAALAAFADQRVLTRWSEMSPTEAPGDQPPVVLVCAGVVGLGRFALGRPDIVALLHERARDPRWRVREAVAMAFQDAGRADPGMVIDVLAPWVGDPHPLVQRAVVASLCEPALLREPTIATRVVGILDTITASLVARPDRRAPDVRVLRQALGYGWSVAIVAAPAVGTATFDRWIAFDDPDVRWIVRENVRKARLRSLEAAWLASARQRAGIPGA